MRLLDFKKTVEKDMKYTTENRHTFTLQRQFAVGDLIVLFLKDQFKKRNLSIHIVSCRTTRRRKT